LFGVSELERRWLEQRKQADVRMYVVWVPMLGAEERHVPEASRLATDSRVRQYWDGANVLGAAYRSVLGLNDTAWDVYLLFGPHQTWTEAEPPKPVFWMHQLHSVTQAPTLDAPDFAREADRLIAAAAAEGRAGR
jgi:hypothetical protein